MLRNKTSNRKKIVCFFLIVSILLIGLSVRLGYLMINRSEYYKKQAEELHERERVIKAARGKIIDANGEILASNKTVCTISTIYSQVEDPEKVIQVLSSELGIPEEKVRKSVEKHTSIERIKTNVEKETGDKIRSYELKGVKVDEDFKRHYTYDTLASKVLGFTGADNQGIIGLEVVYEKYLKGKSGSILTLTDAKGIELENQGERRMEPVAGNDLYISLDTNVQKYAEQAAKKALASKEADSVSVIVMNPQNGEILAMVNTPEFNLNDPFTLVTQTDVSLNEKEKQDLLNQMWRNQSINDTYEPGSTFKIITAAIGLEEGIVHVDDHFHCPGYIMVEDRRIRCHKVTGHGSQTFLEGTMNSCNPVFIKVGLGIGNDLFYEYFKSLGLLSKTGIDLPGEAGTIMHKKENMGLVELATVAFGQSFQITPIQLAATVSSIVNGGTRITPHFGVEVRDPAGQVLKTFEYKQVKNVISKETSDTMKYLLENVVSNGTGKRAYIPGFKIGGKTATSQTLPRSSNKYIASFIGFAPSDNPQVLAMVIIDNPKGIYYGGTVAAPVIQDIFNNILPYLGIEQRYTEEEIAANDIGSITMPDLIGKTKEEAEILLKEYQLKATYLEEGSSIRDQFPLPGETIGITSNIILYLE